MIVPPNQSPIEPTLGWCALISGAAVMTRGITRTACDPRSVTAKVSESILGAGLVLLSVELVASGLPDEVRLPLVVGSIGATVASVAVRRQARRYAAPGADATRRR